MVWMPFFCLAIGFFIGINNLPERTLEIFNKVISVALIMLMLTIGINIGMNDSVMLNINIIGLNCLIISLGAIIFSILFMVIIEKTVLPLEKIRDKLLSENINIKNEISISCNEKRKSSPLIWIMPISIVIGVIFGYFFKMYIRTFILDYILIGSLIMLYASVGIDLGDNRKVFKYIKLLGFKIIYVSIAIFIGSLVGGLVAGIMFSIPLHISVMSASGMSYYSLTGAYMTQVYGIEAGTYGFVVNVMREFFTVLLLPFLIRISIGSPIAGGAAGNMDTMLVPVTKFVGAELGLVALITGVILTVIVPLVLPILHGLL